MIRTKPVAVEEPQVDTELVMQALKDPNRITRELNNRSLFHFLQHFWPVVSAHTFKPNWHIEYLCRELEYVALRVAEGKPREYDLIINVPPGTTKTVTCSIMFPAWCWSRWHWMRFITASYSSTLSLESAEYCRDLIRSTQFQQLYPELDIKQDKDTKSNFRLVKKIVTSVGREPQIIEGGSRYSTSVGGTLTGFHGDILIVDDPLNPQQAVSDVSLETANRWVEQTLSTRKTDKDVTPTILIMQRLHQDDPSGHMLSKQKLNLKHISLPGEARNYKKQIQPPELYDFYKDDLLDPVRLPWRVLTDLEADLGQYGYAGQIGQDPTPPGGGMFKVDHFQFLDVLPRPIEILSTVRYWDKAATAANNKGTGCYTVGVKMSQLTGNRWLVWDVKRGKWGTNEREAIIKETAYADGTRVEIWEEQEPGSSGKDSADATIRNLPGFICKAERPTGDKVFRADPLSVQVNVGSIYLLRGDWNQAFVEEFRFFPFGTYKDQVDATSGAWSKLIGKKFCRSLTKRRNKD